MNFNNLRLTDIIDVKTLQEIQDEFSNATGMAAIIIDKNGTPVTNGSNLTDFCKYTKKSNEGRRRCEKCDKNNADESSHSGHAACTECHAGLMDFYAPVIVHGIQLGAFAGGQVLTSPIDENKIRNYAKELGINPDDYVESAKKLEVVSAKRVEYAASFLSKMANVISELALSKFEITEMAEKSSGNSDISVNMFSQIANAENIMASNQADMKRLNNEFKELEQIAKKSVSEVNSTNETVKIIQDIAMNTRILGFNASLEAARAKESGKGFGVITQEIRTLAETSKESADQIENAMKSLSEFTKKIDKQIQNTETIINDCEKNIEKVSDIIRNIVQ